MTLALDIDAVKHALGRWDEDPLASGLHARRLSLALASEQLRAGFDLVVGQYLAKTAFIEDLEQLAQRHGLAPNNLRVKVYRIRATLHDCIQSCLKNRTANETDSLENHD